MERMKLNFRNNMIDNGLIARCVLTKMFDVEERDIVFMDSRKKNKVTARRFYNYYLWKYKMIRHYKMKDWIHNIHHATSIYQCSIMENQITTYKETRKKFITFLYYADNKCWQKLKIDMDYSLQEINNVDFKKQYIDIINF